MKPFVLLLLASFAVCNSTKADETAVITLADLPAVDTNHRYRQSSPSGYLSVTGDFDGDGYTDIARFFRSGNSYQLMAKLANRSDHILIQGPFNDMPRYGIELLPADTYLKACVKGYGIPCANGDDLIKVRHDAIRFFTFESSARAYHWQDGRFQSFFLSD